MDCNEQIPRLIIKLGLFGCGIPKTTTVKVGWSPLVSSLDVLCVKLLVAVFVVIVSATRMNVRLRLLPCRVGVGDVVLEVGELTRAVTRQAIFTCILRFQ
jgi:hypothetical protein